VTTGGGHLSGVAPGPLKQLGILARHVRMAVTLVVFGLLLLGTWKGSDDDFPFGPFRMYATTDKPDGVISVLALQKRVGADPWETTRLTPGNVAINRAELEGSLGRAVANPRLLGKLADAYAHKHPDEPAWSAVRVVRRSQQLHDSRPIGEVTETVVVTWERS
jgi:hypothetical protein